MNKNIIIKAVGIFGVHTKKGYALAVALREFFGKRAKIVGFLPKRYEYYMCKDKGNVESNFHKEFNSRKNNFKIFNCFHYADWPYINIKYNDAERVLLEECNEYYIFKKNKVSLYLVKDLLVQGLVSNIKVDDNCIPVVKVSKKHVKYERLFRRSIINSSEIKQ